MDNTENIIRSSAAAGLGRQAVEALLKRKLSESELQIFRAAKAVYDLNQKKKRREKDYERLTSSERVWKHRDKVASIDAELDQAVLGIDQNRRNAAFESPEKFIETYLIGTLFEETPSEHFREAIRQMYAALIDNRPYNIELPRGSGKTTAAEALMIYLLAYGIKKFLVIVSQNGKSAACIMNDIWRVLSEQGTAFAQDFPEICKPFELCHGATRRRQLYRGKSTDIVRNSGMIQFPRIENENGEAPTSRSVITVRGISSGMRGLKVGSLRPDAVILDDLQTAQSAASPSQVEKILELINKDIMNLASKGKMAVLMTSTPIMPDDLCERIENCVSWKTTKYQAVLKWPTDIVENGDNGLWGQYFRIYDKECMTDSSHAESLEFYKKNLEKMNEGSETFQDRYKESDGHVSAIQALLEKRHLIGESAFEAEMQMKPKKMSMALDIYPKNVVQRIGTFHELEIPDQYILVTAATDLNVSYAMTTSITAFKRDRSSVVLYHDITPTRIDGKLNDADYNQRVYEKLCEIGNKISRLGLKIDGWGIDAGGRNFETVCEFARNSMHTCGLPACAMIGRASAVFNPNVKSRLRDAISRTVLCGDTAEHNKAGTGHKYMFFDSDVYREAFQKAILSPYGAIGGCLLYDGTPEEHSEFAIQTTNEKIKYIRHRQDGRDEYSWTSKEPHDYLDTMAMCYAIAGSLGVSGQSQTVMNLQKLRRVQNQKRRIRIV